MISVKDLEDNSTACVSLCRQLCRRRWLQNQLLRELKTDRPLWASWMRAELKHWRFILLCPQN